MTQPIDLSLQSLVPKAVSAIDEREMRIQLAATYRLIERYGMSDLVCTHISTRVPDSQGQFLLNPYGVMFDEITASSLIKVDLDGNVIDKGDREVNPAGFIIHSAIYKARPDINCIVHTHSRYGVAVSALESGLLPLTQIALMFYNRVAYHDYEGASLELDERDRLVKSLGDKKVMILRNHGLLTAGETIPEAFILTYYLEKACEVQILAQSSGSQLVIPSETVCEESAQQQEIVVSGQLQFPALLRMLDRTDPSYRD